MRVAFYGGSFDPPHLGHLRIAQAAADRLGIDQVLLAPAALQPLKRGGPPPAGYSDRLAMVKLLCAADPRLAASELDAPRPDSRPNYTWDTLALLRQALGPADALFMLVGADAFLTLHQWHRAAELLLGADWIVAARPGFDLASPGWLSNALPAGVMPKSEIEQHPGWTRQHLIAAPGAPGEDRPRQAATSLYLLPDLREDIAATEIRSALAGPGGAPQRVLAPPVLRHIRQHALYR